MFNEPNFSAAKTKRTSYRRRKKILLLFVYKDFLLLFLQTKADEERHWVIFSPHI
jgi:hypothetical protein